MIAKPVLIGVLCSIGFVSCNKHSSDSQPTASLASSVVAATTDESNEQAKIPVKEDYEEQAQQDITEDNLDERIGQLEKQILEDR